MKIQIAKEKEEENTSMGKQLGKEEEKKGEKGTRDNPNKNKEVIITVYIESSSPPPPPPIHVQQKGATKKSKPVPKTGGYDRRAQLLAYAKELRNADTKQPQWPKNTPNPRHKVSVIFYIFLL